jgi:putative transposase
VQFKQRVRRVLHPRPGKTLTMIELVSPYVHYYNRRVNKEAIFFSDVNYDYLLNLIYKFLPDYSIELIAYCLMPNHYHLLLKIDSLKIGSKFIQRLFNAYTQGVNKLENRVGTLFQGNVKKRLIESDDYLREAIRYIHQNPIKSGLVLKPESWKYSDYSEWVGLKSSKRQIYQQCISLFGSVDEYKKWIQILSE